MKKSAVLYLLIIVLMLSNCRGKKSSFESYWKSLPVIKLPLKFACGISNIHTLFKDTATLYKYSFEGANVVGRIADKKNVYIIYSYPGDICYPYLYTYNKQGKKLDSLYLHISTCTGDEYVSFSTSTIINPDKSIVMFDTESNFSEDTITNARFLTSTVMHKRIYKMNSEGIPELVSHKRDSICSHTKVD